MTHVEEAATAPWLYPMVAKAVYTGARRRGLLRRQVADVDFDARTALAREMKRSRRERTTRRVALTPAVSNVSRNRLQ